MRTPSLALRLLRAGELTSVCLLAACGGVFDPPSTADSAAAAVTAPQATGALQAAQASPQPATPAAVAADSAAMAQTSAWRFAAQPADQSLQPGEAASFQVRVEGGSGAFEYQWLRDGEPIDGATGSQYSFVTTLDDGGATFSVRVRPHGDGPGHERESAPASVVWRQPAT